MKATNQYHILHHIPAVEAYEMPPLLEAMARQLVESGRLRINADFSRNFVSYSSTTSEHNFSARELHDPLLVPRTKSILRASVPEGLGPMAVNETLHTLRATLKTASGISAEKEMRVARLLVQAAHPVVIATLLRERAEVFVSYSHDVGDLMAIHTWHQIGGASGLQTTSDSGAGVYVSCGGDPFFDGTEDQKTYSTDGFDALARMMVIAGQELGHFADLVRTPQGHIGGRVSADMGGPLLRPSAAAKAGRDGDIHTVWQLHQQLARAGLGALLRCEQHIAFYKKQRRTLSPIYGFYQCKRVIWWLAFQLRAPRHIPPFERTTPRFPCATYYSTLLSDMAFNLSPKADAYAREHPVEEEAIACIEALARVPQQVHKWGHRVTKRCMPGLYRLYYGEVIHGLSQHLSAKQRAALAHAYRLPLWQSLWMGLRHLLRRRPGYLR
jgi:hypothetical protein